METNEVIAKLLEERGPMSTTDITKALAELGELPPYWTVLDVSDYLKEWFSGHQ